jgi:hypothetical protein
LSSPLLLLRYGYRHGRMNRVISSQGMVLVLLLTVHGHVHRVDGSEYHSWGPSWLPVLPKGSTCPSGEAEMCRGGSSAFDDVTGAWARRRDVA